MSERKVLNKYYPPDFDPSKIPKSKGGRNRTFSIRIMAPFNMRCNTCGEYIYKGKKFNSRKENVDGEDYLGLRIFRFYIKCPRCVAEIAFKTDLKNTDYALEDGAQRLFEAEKLALEMAERERKEKEDEELNPMKVLENRTKVSRQEMDQIDALEELREINARSANVETDQMLEMHAEYEKQLQKLQEESEEEEIRSIFGKSDQGTLKRLHEDSEEEDDIEPPEKKIAECEKPTDIFAKNISSVKPQQHKKAQVWERSVGSMSKKSLSGLVVKKKTTSASTSRGENSATSDAIRQKTNISTTNQKNSDGDGPGTSVDRISTENSAAKLRQSGSPADNKLCQESESKLANQGAVKDVASTSHTATSGLGLLGNYSDSDSENSES